MSKAVYQYCPMCATTLHEMQHSGQSRMACGACGFVQWGNPVPVVAALVEYEGKVLLARNVAWPAHFYALITGFLECNETPEQGAIRELKEETNLDAVEIDECSWGGGKFTETNEGNNKNKSSKLSDFGRRAILRVYKEVEYRCKHRKK